MHFPKEAHRRLEGALLRLFFGEEYLRAQTVDVRESAGRVLCNTIFRSGVPEGSWEKVWSGLAIACNFVVYAVFWYVCLWVAGSFREREHPYDRQISLGPPSLR